MPTNLKYNKRIENRGIVPITCEELFKKIGEDKEVFSFCSKLQTTIFTTTTTIAAYKF